MGFFLKPGQKYIHIIQSWLEIDKYSSVAYPDCNHSVGHIHLFEPLKYRAPLPAAFLF